MKEQIIKILNEFKFDIPLEVGSATIINADDFPAIAEKIADGWVKVETGIKNYLAFYGSYYYPAGGMGDFIGDYDTPEEAVNAIIEKNKAEDDDWDYHWANVYSIKDKTDTPFKP